jgi:Phospholipase_D-nuclease N-terminal/Short C-terminal domain
MQDDFGLWEVLVSMFWFMFLIIWIWMLISILADIFRDRDLGGGTKALWTLFIIVIPWLGALVYIFARGSSMHERQAKQVAAQEADMRAYVQDAAGTKSVADELKGLTDLRDSGVLTPEEYEAAKAKVLS